MRRAASAILLTTLLAGCGEPAGPGAPPSPSLLEVSFSGDSTTGERGSRILDPAAQNRVTATWTRCPDEDFLMYVLFRSETPGVAESGPGVSGLVTLSDPDILTYTDEDVEWTTTYYYALLTLDSEGLGSWSDEASILTPDISPTASTLRLDTTWIDHTTLSWTPCPDADFEEYRVYWSEEPGIVENPDQAYTVGVYTDASDTTAVDSSFSWGSSYYAVRTRNSLDAVAWSNEIEVVTSSPDFPWQVTSILEPGGFLGSVIIDPDGSALYSTDESTFRILRTVLPSMLTSERATSPAPVAISLSPDGTLAFVPCDIAGSLEVFVAQSVIPCGSLDLGGSPSCTASPPVGMHVFCGCTQSHRVFAVRTTDLVVTAEISPGNGPAGMACDASGTRLYVSCRYDDAVAFLDAPDLELQTTVQVGDGPGPLALSADGSRLYVACQPAGEVWVLAAGSGAVLRVLAEIGDPTGMAETPDGDLLYVADADAGRVLLYDTQSWQHVHTVDIGIDAGEIRCSPDGQWLVAAGGIAGTLVFIGL